jgi:hypothetical protein
MNRNQKIALGCGGAGCLGLIVVLIAAGLLYFFSFRGSYSTNSRANSNVTTIRNENSSSPSSSSSSSSVATMSEDDKHKLYQAAMMTGDTELGNRVSIKLGLLNEDNTPTDYYEQFITGHVDWAPRNLKFIQSIGTPDKARAYVDENLAD